MKYRTRLTIAARVLEVAEQGPVSKTRIVYGAYLSYAQVQKYLRVLVDARLLEEDRIGIGYSLTPKGLEFLNLYRAMAKLIGGEAAPLFEALVPRSGT